MSPRHQPISTDAWATEAEPADESAWTPGGEGWSAWNEMSPEREFCEFAVALIGLVRPGLVIETGIGQGYLTRRVLAGLPHRYLGYESDDDLRSRLRKLAIWTATAQLSDIPEPTAETMASCDLAILDSAMAQRQQEFGLWREHAPAGAYVLIHDARPDHPKKNGIHRQAARYLAGDGVFLGNPRGSWLYRKPL